ncbi:PqqD family protein [Hoeflea poritis]|uniref:PqqD family protein n=1 Tax=Hoeflea poritis TaxID=2993659 RepID=A0ABT4VIV2_9HYPH|nr:PqqD family protein [Hoeflea poritis]MDA4844057.1 PqqD family protein [Hoeflea poritis]
MESNKYECVYRLANKDVASEEFDGEFVVLDLNNGRYYSMDGSAAIVWKALTEGSSPNHLAAACEDAGHFVPETIYGFCDQLESYGLLVPTTDRSDIALPLALAQAIRSKQLPPETTMFDDLAELMMADPIHEVDEAEGWPVRKPVPNGAAD